MNDHAAAQRRTRIDDHARVEVAVVADHHALAEAASGTDVRAFANDRISFDYRMGIYGGVDASRPKNAPRRSDGLPGDKFSADATTLPALAKARRGCAAINSGLPAAEVAANSPAITALAFEAKACGKCLSCWTNTRSPGAAARCWQLSRRDAAIADQACRDEFR